MDKRLEDILYKTLNLLLKKMEQEIMSLSAHDLQVLASTIDFISNTLQNKQGHKTWQQHP